MRARHEAHDEQHADRRAGSRRPTPPGPAISPRPRRNQPWGVSRASVAIRPRAPSRVGANVPPRIPSVIATAELAAPAASAVWNERHDERRDPDRRERSRATTSSSDAQRRPPVGADQERRRDDQHRHRDDPLEEAAERLAGEDRVRARSGPARIRAQRPARPLVEQADEPHLGREEQEQDRHRRGVVGRQVELAELARLVDERDGRRRAAAAAGDPRELVVGRRRPATTPAAVATDSCTADDAVAEPLRRRPRDLRREALVARPDDLERDRLPRLDRHREARPGR